MKSIITGSHGFIGKNLAIFLKKKGEEVFPIHHALLQKKDSLKKEVARINPDYIFHFAAYGNHAQQNNPDKIFSGNIIGLYNLLRAVKILPIKAFINVGSSSEYGKKLVPMTENDFLEADTLYGASKVSTTYLCRAYARQFDKPIVTIRPFSVFGEGEAHSRFIPKVILSLLNGDRLELDPEPKHDWIYIQDFLYGVFAVLSNIASLKGEVVNIGTGKQYSNLEVVQALEKISKKILTIKILENMREYDSTNWICANKKLKLLGWKQKYDLRNGLQETYNYYAKQRS